MKASLTFFAGTGESQTVGLPQTGALTVGRASDNSVVIDHPSVSSHHARFDERGGAWWVRDLGSRNGTQLNATRVTESKLQHGDSLILGAIGLKFEAAAEAAPQDTTEADIAAPAPTQAMEPADATAAGVAEEDTPPPRPDRKQAAAPAAEKPPPRGPATSREPLAGFRGLGTQALTGLTLAVDPSKIGFFLLGTFATWIIIFPLASLVVISINDNTTSTLLVLLIAALIIGLAGVVAGGIAFMVREESVGYRAGVMRTIDFARRRFLSLFTSTLLLGGFILLAASLINRLFYLLAHKPGVLRGLAGLLFPCHFLINAFLVMVFCTSVLVVCAAGFDELKPVAAVLRVLTVARQQVQGLIAHVVCTLLFAMLLWRALLVVAGTAVLPTLVTNAPRQLDLPALIAAAAEDIASSSSEKDSPEPGLWGYSNKNTDGERLLENKLFGKPVSKTSLSERLHRRDNGDMLRWFSLGLIVMVVFSVPVIYWICSFACFYLTLPVSGRPSP